MLKLASKYEALAKSAKKSNDRSRKDLSKDLDRAKKSHEKASNLAQIAQGQLDKMQKELESAKSEMEAARKTIMRCHELMRGMDLSGASSVKDSGDDVSYVIDGKEHYVNFADDGGVEAIPMRQHRKMHKDRNNADDENCANDSVDLDSFLE